MLYIIINIGGSVIRIAEWEHGFLLLLIKLLRKTSFSDCCILDIYGCFVQVKKSFVDFFKPWPRNPQHSGWQLSPGCWMSSLQPMCSEPRTPGRYQPYSTWAKRKICTHLVRLMHPRARILLYMCAFCLQGWGEELC